MNDIECFRVMDIIVPIKNKLEKEFDNLQESLKNKKPELIEEESEESYKHDLEVIAKLSKHLSEIASGDESSDSDKSLLKKLTDIQSNIPEDCFLDIDLDDRTLEISYSSRNGLCGSIRSDDIEDFDIMLDYIKKKIDKDNLYLEDGNE